MCLVSMLITARSATSPAMLGRFLIATFVLSSVMATSCSREAANQQAPGAESGGGANARGGRGGGRGAGGGPVPVVTGAQRGRSPCPVTIPAVGTAEPLVTVQVRAQVTGQLSRVHFREGQDVNKGDTLFTLDARPFEAALRQAEAVLARDTAQSKNAQAQQARYEDLFDRGLIPRDQYETQVGHGRGARGDARGRPVAGRERAAEPSVHDDQGADLRPHGRAGRARRATWFAPTIRRRWSSSTRSRRSTCRSRCRAGIFRDIRQTRRSSRCGSRPSQQGGAPGARRRAARRAGLTCRGAGRRRPAGDPGERRRSVEGRRRQLHRQRRDPTTGTIKLKGTFANADHALWPGLFVQVTLVLGTDPNAHRRAGGGGSGSQAGQYVFVVKPDRTVEMRNVTVERQQGEEMVIAQGLDGGRRGRHRRPAAADARARVSRPAREAQGGGGRWQEAARRRQRRSGGDGSGRGRRGREGNQS